MRRVFCQLSFLRVILQIDMQTNTQRQKHKFLGGGNKDYHVVLAAVKACERGRRLGKAGPVR